MTVKHLTNVLHPPELKAQIEKDLEYRPSLKMDVKSFIKHVAMQAEHIEKSKGFSKSLTNKPESTRTDLLSKSEDTTKKRNDRKKPICLFPPHKEKGFRHFLDDCKDCPPDQKSKLIENYKANRNKNKRDGTREWLRENRNLRLMISSWMR